MVEQPLIDISPENWRIVRDILQRHVPDREVWAFGSRAKWTAKEFSDLDIAVIGDEPLSIAVMAELSEAFQDSALPFKVDVVDWVAITPAFRKVVETSKISLQVATSEDAQWATEHLDDLCSLIADCPHSTPVWTQSGHLVIRNQNIKNGRLDLTEKSFTDHEHYLIRVRRAKPQEGDLIFTREAPMGEICMVPSGLDCCVGQRQVLLRPNPSMVYPRFLLYAMQSPAVQNQISWNEGTGSTVSNVRIPVLKKLRVPHPSLDVQREIADTLGCIDDKISLLRETNVTFEAIAQALFKSWFVDFDPVRAKAKAEGGEPEGVPPEVAELFPSEFEDSELGEIPKGWSVSTFGDIADVNGGGTPSTKDDSFWTGGIHCWATPKDLSALDFPVLLDTERKITNAGLAKISSGLLPVGTLLMSSRAPIGYLAIAEVPTAINQGFIAMRPKNGATNLFLLSLVRWRMDDIKNRANGSTFMEISKSAFRPIQVVMPAPDVVEQFDSVVRLFYNRLVSNMEQIEALSSTRDSLLPRLMSGGLQLDTASSQYLSETSD